MMGIKAGSPDSWPSSLCTKPQVCCFFAAEATQCSLERMSISSGRMKAHGEASEDQRGRVKANDFLKG